MQHTYKVAASFSFLATMSHTALNITWKSPSAFWEVFDTEGSLSAHMEPDAKLFGSHIDISLTILPPDILKIYI